MKIRHSLQVAKLTRFASLRNQCANKIQKTSSFSQFHREYVGRNTPNATHMWPVHRFLSPPSPPLTLRNDVDVRCPGTTLAGAGRMALKFGPLLLVTTKINGGSYVCIRSYLEMRIRNACFQMAFGVGQFNTFKSVHVANHCRMFCLFK